MSLISHSMKKKLFAKNIHVNQQFSLRPAARQKQPRHCESSGTSHHAEAAEEQEGVPGANDPSRPVSHQWAQLTHMNLKSLDSKSEITCR